MILFKRPKQQFYYINDPQMGWGQRSERGVEIHEIDFRQQGDSARAARPPVRGRTGRVLGTSQPAHSQARAVDRKPAGSFTGSVQQLAKFMKFDKRQILRNVGSSWFALGVNVLVGIFLSPYILHRLGDDAFGLWILIFSVTGYYGLFDLGIRSSIVRYVAKYSAT